MLIRMHSNTNTNTVPQMKIIPVTEGDIQSIICSLKSKNTSGYDGMSTAVAYPGILFGGQVQQIQLRTEDRENGDLGVVAP